MNNLMDYGKLPPQAVELEEAVLGAVLIEKDAINEVLGLISEQSFYKDAHAKIWSAVYSLYVSQRQIDILTVTQELMKKGELQNVGGALYVAQLSNKVASSYNIKDYAKIISEKHLARQLITEATEILKEAYTETTDAFELVDGVLDRLFKVQSQFNKNSEVEFLDKVAEVSFELKAAAEKGYITGVPTGSAALDRHTGGYQKGDLIIGGARPSMGKTTFTVDKALKQAKAGIKVGYISLEVTAKALIKKMYSNDLGIDGKVINRGGLNYSQWQQFDQTTAKLMSLPIWVYDCNDTSILAICSWMRKVRQKYGVEMFYMDYIQLAKAVNKKRGEDANRDVSEISKSLKQAAMSLDVPIYALSQLSREVEKRSNKKPILSDLRDSGCLLGSTLIYCPRLKKYIRIEDLDGKKNFYILAENSGVMKESIASKCFTTGEKECFELELINGQKITATSDHKIYTSNGWVELKDLKDSSVAIPLSYSKEVVSEYTDEEISLVGHFLANGCGLKKHSLTYTCNGADLDLVDKVMKDAIAATAEKVSPYFNGTITEKSTYNTVFFKSKERLTHRKGNPVADILRKHGIWDKRAKEKFVPDALFFIPANQIHILLKSLFSGDGTCVYSEKNGRKSLGISYSSSSELLICGIQKLLASVGIVSFISRVENSKKQVWFNLSIYGKSNIELYVKNIGFWNKRKNDKMIDGWERSKENLAGWNKYSFNEQRSLCFMPVKSINSIGIKKVYDIEVPKYHNFMANGIVVHNSLEQDADMVMFFFRPEYYGVKQFEDGSATDGLCIVDISKFRNGETKLLMQKFDGALSRFDDITHDEPAPF
jgi:replicative DNA helicase